MHVLKTARALQEETPDERWTVCAPMSESEFVVRDNECVACEDAAIRVRLDIT